MINANDSFLSPPFNGRLAGSARPTYLHGFMINPDISNPLIANCQLGQCHQNAADISEIGGQCPPYESNNSFLRPTLMAGL